MGVDWLREDVISRSHGSGEVVSQRLPGRPAVFVRPLQAGHPRRRFSFTPWLIRSERESQMGRVEGERGDDEGGCGREVCCKGKGAGRELLIPQIDYAILCLVCLGLIEGHPSASCEPVHARKLIE